MGGHDDKAQGKWDETKGTVKEKAGELTDNERLEAEGKTDQVKGKGQQAVGNLKEAGEKTKDAIQDAFE